MKDHPQMTQSAQRGSRRHLGRITRLMCVVAMVAALTIAGGGAGMKFYPDDPIARDPERQDASDVRPWDISDLYDFVENTFLGPGDHTDGRAENVNTLDEVPDSSWFTNRIGARQMSVDEIVSGPDRGSGPKPGAWTIIDGKSEGITPGLTIRDSAGDVYFVKFDPPSNPEMATGAEVVSTKFFYALGYNVPENYLASFRRDRLVIDAGVRLRRPDGRREPMTERDLDALLEKAARHPDGSYRVVASLRLEGKDLGPYRYYGTRPDDPNDIFSHEHRRELRGLRVFSAWLNHDDSRSINSRDFLVQEDGRSLVRHYLIDFGSTLGSGSVQAQKPRAGNEYIWEARPTFITMLTLGFYVRPWIKVKFPETPALGRIEADFFQPARWKPEYPNPAFLNARPDDAFWGARRVAAFSDEAIRAVVRTARFSDPRAEAYLLEVLIKRRDKVGRQWLNDVNPLVDWSLDASGTLTFRNAASIARAATEAERYEVTWSRFDNATGEATKVGETEKMIEPRAQAPGELIRGGGEYIMAAISAFHRDHASWAVPVRVWFRRTAGGWQVVGIERVPDRDARKRS